MTNSPALEYSMLPFIVPARFPRPGLGSRLDPLKRTLYLRLFTSNKSSAIN